MRPVDAGANMRLEPNALWSRRVTAAVIDAIPLTPLYILNQSTNFAMTGGISPVIYWIVASLSAVYVVANVAVIQGRSGASFGKRAMSIVVVGSATHLPVGIPRTIARALAHALDLLTCGIGFLWPLWDPCRQTFADKFAATIVISRTAEMSNR